jgi:catechol 2,3-dioxygenase-like lactoylglutathione lyase family enzyme
MNDKAAISNKGVYSGFAVPDVAKAKDFYERVLGLEVTEESGGLELKLPSGAGVLVYPKPDHTPATFTILNLQVTDIEATVDALVAQGVKFEHYDGMTQDERGILRDEGPLIAWFTDPAGNIMSVIQE